METLNFAKTSNIVRDHAIHPRNYGALEQFDGHARITGCCGDTMEFWLVVQNGTIHKISFTTDGQESAIACGSMTTVFVDGKSVESAAFLAHDELLKALGGLPPPVEHCAQLAVNTLSAACDDYYKNSEQASSQSNRGLPRCEDGSVSKPQSMASKKNGEQDQIEEQRKIQSRLSGIRYKIAVLSGKGGVGKSTIAVNLATALMLSGKRVGLLDIDFHGPSIPTMLGIERATINTNEEGFLPVKVGTLKVMSLGFLLRHQDEAVIWRGPMKMGLIKQFIKDVVWGELDYLIIDFPPGTGDDPLSVCQVIGTLDGAVVVTTPQKVAAADVRKSIDFCRKLHVPILGVVENMNGFTCPRCGEVAHIFPSGEGKRIAEDMRVPFLGSLPIDPQIAASGDCGRAFVEHYPESCTAEVMRKVVDQMKSLEIVTEVSINQKNNLQKEYELMKIAIPLANGKLSAHFGHCEQFALVEVDSADKKILNREDIQAPPHEPGMLPQWLAQRGANTIIAGGMGQRAQSLFDQQGIQVVVGAPPVTPEQIVTDYLAGALQVGENLCDH